MYHEQSRLTLEEAHGSWWLCERFVYGRSSVLEGQDGRQLIRPYDSLHDAQVANPGVSVNDEWYEPPVVPMNPPDDWSEEDCGERWEEDE